MWPGGSSLRPICQGPDLRRRAIRAAAAAIGRRMASACRIPWLAAASRRTGAPSAEAISLAVPATAETWTDSSDMLAATWSTPSASAPVLASCSSARSTAALLRASSHCAPA